MKTTIDMPNALFQRIKAMARKRHVTMRELITEGLLHVLEQKGAETPRPIAPVTFRGKGISPEFSKAAWPGLRDAIYEDRGS